MRLSQIKPYIPYIIGGLMLLGVLGYYLYTQAPSVGATILYPSGGGTGTSTNPSYGQVLVGNSGGTYSLTSTSSLNIASFVASGTYDPYGQATSTLNSFTGGVNGYYATTTHPLISSLPSLSITKSQVSDFGTYLTSYDAFTHPAVGQSATTSLMVLNGNASTTQLTSTGSTYLATTGGNVGIGTTSPSSILTLGSGQLELPVGSASAPSITFTGSASLNTGIFASSITGTQTIQFTTSGTSRLLINSNDITSTRPIIGNAGLLTKLGYSFSSNITTGMWLPSAGNLGLVANGIEGIRIDSSGNVGIGTTSPYAKLSVSGRGVFNQDIRADYFTSTSTTVFSTFPLITSTNASSTLFSSTYASSTLGYFGSITMTGDFTPNASFGGRSITVNGSSVDADAELYTVTLASFNIGSSTMSTTTGTFMQKLIPSAATITSIYCSTNVGTSTIELEERDPADPNTAGTDILYSAGLRCGSGSGQVASSTLSNNTLDANDIINLEIKDAEPTGSKPTIIRVFIKGTFND